MRKFTRTEEPKFLSENWEEWGKEWQQKRDATPGVGFYWHKVDGEHVNQKLMPALKAQTQDHCSFCDNFPVSPPSIDTIEHFRPKSQFPLEAYKWTNLYFCCVYCQQKGSNFDELALQPDAFEYEFNRYFSWDYTLGEIVANKAASPEDQLRAKATIALYALNIEHPSLRKRAMRLWIKNTDEPLDGFPYRDFIGEP